MEIMSQGSIYILHNHTVYIVYHKLIHYIMGIYNKVKYNIIFNILMPIYVLSIYICIIHKLLFFDF